MLKSINLYIIGQEYYNYFIVFYLQRTKSNAYIIGGSALKEKDKDV